MKLLFICSQNRLRSPTAEAVFSAYSGVEAISAGTNNDAPTPVSTDLIEWADVILCMEKAHRNKLTSKFKKEFKCDFSRPFRHLFFTTIPPGPAL